MIYCVEDDLSIRELIVYTLKNSGFDARGFETGAELFEALAAERPALLLLDLMLPGEDGLSILHRIRASSDLATLPVILVTAKGSEYDRIRGLDTGADDYITKPFSMLELVSRMRAVLRRAVPHSGPRALLCGPVALDAQAHSVSVSGAPVSLTLKEFELLQLLMENTGLVLTRDRLLERIWGYDFDGETRTVDVHIRTLRQKLGDGAGIIETVRGVGYRIGRPQ